MVIANANCKENWHLYKCCAKASSQTINFTSRSNSTKSLCTGIKHIESLPMAIGILKIEFEVRPPSNRRAAMPKEVTPMATCPSHRIDANNTLYTKVYMTHLDHLGKILRLHLGLLC
ncbi:unnamed protein product [Sphagnum jensenii]|uniref:Uncharacterized protein n=1 Tax=Sphagnum jensenii TaxID=128206 RepID=A0ABP1ABK0_9BRYO